MIRAVLNAFAFGCLIWAAGDMPRGDHLFLLPAIVLTGLATGCGIASAIEDLWS